MPLKQKHGGLRKNKGGRPKKKKGPGIRSNEKWCHRKSYGSAQRNAQKRENYKNTIIDESRMQIKIDKQEKAQLKSQLNQYQQEYADLYEILGSFASESEITELLSSARDVAIDYDVTANGMFMNMTLDYVKENNTAKAQIRKHIISGINNGYGGIAEQRDQLLARVWSHYEIRQFIKHPFHLFIYIFLLLMFMFAVSSDVCVSGDGTPRENTEYQGMGIECEDIIYPNLRLKNVWKCNDNTSSKAIIEYRHIATKHAECTANDTRDVMQEIEGCMDILLQDDNRKVWVDAYEVNLNTIAINERIQSQKPDDHTVMSMPPLFMPRLMRFRDPSKDDHD